MTESRSRDDGAPEADFTGVMRRAGLQVPDSLYDGTLAGFREINAHLAVLREVVPGIGDPFYAHRFTREEDGNDSVA